MLDFFTGCDHYATADLTTGVPGRFTGHSAAIVTTSTKRTGTSALSFSTTGGYITKGGLSNAATRVLGFAFYVPNVAGVSSDFAFCALGEGNLVYDGSASNVHVALTLNSSGTISAHRGRDLNASALGTLLGTSTNALTSATWNYLELVVTVHGSTGTVELFVNGSKTNWLDLSGQNTLAGSNAYINMFGFQSLASIPVFDDIYCVSSTGGTRTTRLGDVKAVSIAASAGDGAVANFTPSTGTDNGAMVDDATPDGDTTYNASATPGNIDTYAFPASGVNGPVLGVQIHNYMKKTDAGTCDAQSVARIGGSNYLGTQTGVATSYGFLTHLHELSPASAADFTAGEIDGAEFGVKHAA